MAGDENEWVRVPRKITEAMCDACHNAPGGFAGSPPHPQHLWDAMLAAAPAPEDGRGDAVTDESLRAWREMADDVHGRFFWMLSPDKRGNHTVSHESVRAVVKLCEEIEAGTPAYENLELAQAERQGESDG